MSIVEHRTFMGYETIICPNCLILAYVRIREVEVEWSMKIGKFHKGLTCYISFPNEVNQLKWRSPSALLPLSPLPLPSPPRWGYHTTPSRPSTDFQEINPLVTTLHGNGSSQLETKIKLFLQIQRSARALKYSSRISVSANHGFYEEFQV